MERYYGKYQGILILTVLLLKTAIYCLLRYHLAIIQFNPLEYLQQRMHLANAIRNKQRERIYILCLRCLRWKEISNQLLWIRMLKYLRIVFLVAQNHSWFLLKRKEYSLMSQVNLQDIRSLCIYLVTLPIAYWDLGSVWRNQLAHLTARFAHKIVRNS